MRTSITAMLSLLAAASIAAGPSYAEQATKPGAPGNAAKTASPTQAAPVPFATFPLGTVLGTHGYFEVTPAGSLVFYPAWTSINPNVMQTIFAMMGATSLVNQRGHYQIGSDEKVRFFLPPGTTPGFFDPRYVPPIRPYFPPNRKPDQRQGPPRQ